MKISLLPFDDIEDDILEVLEEELKVLADDVTILPAEEVPQESFNPEREQHLANFFSDIAKEKEGEIVLGVTDVDLYSGTLNFVLGIADTGSGKAAVISTCRLRSSDRELFHGRMVKEAIHEIGHLLGLGHCSNKYCVMHFSNRVADTDIKGKEYCPSCMDMLKALGHRRVGL